ncbi:hypothetical protein [Microvirga roseola]|uniref:hypothetical protein n=1 Tax=Microvirga roseola TaxID=2883126 RepID=UPI001E3787FA|nr:hypothetical protein [Microvirga roseola]
MSWKERVPLRGRNTGSRVVETDVEARQGPKGRPVLMVLLASALLLGLYLVGMLIWSFTSAPTAPREATLPEVPVTGDIQTREPDQTEIPPANPAYPVPAAE